MNLCILAGLALLLFVALTGTLVLSDSLEWVDAYSPNLTTEVLGIIITLILVERVLVAERERDRVRVARVAAALLRTPIFQLANAFSKMLKASFEEMPQPVPHTFKALFRPDFTSELRYFDFARPAPTLYPNSWFRYAHDEVHGAVTSIESVLNRYAAFLPIAYVEAIEQLVADPLINILKNATTIEPQVKKGNVDSRLFGHETVDPARERFFRRLLQLFAAHDDLAQEPISLGKDWHEPKMSPKVCSCRREGTDQRSTLTIGKPQE